MVDLRKEYDLLIEDLEKNIKNQEDLKYIRQRVNVFVDMILKEMKNIVDFKEDKMKQLEEAQNKMEEKLNKMQQVVDNIEKDIYTEDGFDFEIVCPYCNYEFVIDTDEEKNEIECPECNNIIELDWSGENEEDCSGNCMGCNGCNEENIEEIKEEEQDNANSQKKQDDNEDDM